MAKDRKQFKCPSKGTSHLKDWMSMQGSSYPVQVYKEWDSFPSAFRSDEWIRQISSARCKTIYNVTKCVFLKGRVWILGPWLCSLCENSSSRTLTLCVLFCICNIYIKGLPENSKKGGDSRYTYANTYRKCFWMNIPQTVNVDAIKERCWGKMIEQRPFSMVFLFLSK